MDQKTIQEIEVIANRLYEITREDKECAYFLGFVPKCEKNAEVIVSYSGPDPGLSFLSDKFTDLLRKERELAKQKTKHSQQNQRKMKLLLKKFA